MYLKDINGLAAYDYCDISNCCVLTVMSAWVFLSRSQVMLY